MDTHARRQMRAWREALGLPVADPAAETAYGEALICEVEGGKRTAKPEYLDKPDDVLRADHAARL
ncbi:hypothetical protein [Streptomyces sp. NPDC051109]|uniref:hypothetical protein n=1 Tax=Streptomyces sp. NPDC051109 TaxID=3365642 RepID=UPI0037ABDAF5